MAVAYVTALPYATQEGELTIPDGLSEDEAQEYITNHWKDIKFGEPQLDYHGTDFDFEVQSD